MGRMGVGVGDMKKSTYDPDGDAKIALAQLVAAVCSKTEAGMIADEKITTHKNNASAHHTKTTAAGNITSGRFPVDRLPALSDEKIWKGTGGNVEEVDEPWLPACPTKLDASWSNSNHSSAGEHTVVSEISGMGIAHVHFVGNGTCSVMRIYVDGAQLWSVSCSKESDVDVIFTTSFKVTEYAGTTSKTNSAGTARGNYKSL